MSSIANFFINDKSPKKSKPKLPYYIAGYLLSIYLTVSGYLLAVNHAFTNNWLVVFVISLAIIQFVVQILLFLHLGQESGPRWKLAAFIFMFIVVGILVIGSLWIMYNLNYRMTPQQINNYLNNQSEDGL